MKPMVLIVEDEAPLVTLLKYNLEKEGFAVCSAGDGEEALLQIAENKPDAVLLDWMLPLVSGLEVCRQIRRSPSSRSLPIILLTARGEDADRVRGLDSGADDYIVKPFSTAELVARVRALLRRSSGQLSERRIDLGDLRIDPSRRVVERDGATVPLTTLEFDLLYFLAARPGRVFSREALMEHVWGTERVVDERSIDSLVSRLRRKLERDPAAPSYLQTVWGAGYRLMAPA